MNEAVEERPPRGELFPVLGGKPAFTQAYGGDTLLILLIKK